MISVARWPIFSTAAGTTSCAVTVASSMTVVTNPASASGTPLSTAYTGSAESVRKNEVKPSRLIPTSAGIPGMRSIHPPVLNRSVGPVA